MLSCSFRTGTTTDNSTAALARGLPDTSIHLAGPVAAKKDNYPIAARQGILLARSPQVSATNGSNVLHSKAQEAVKDMKTYVIQETFENMGFRRCRKRQHRPVEVLS